MNILKTKLSKTQGFIIAALSYCLGVLGVFVWASSYILGDVKFWIIGFGLMIWAILNFVLLIGTAEVEKL